MYVCDSKCMLLLVCIPKKASDPLELEFYAVMSYPPWVLWIELWSSERARIISSQWDISPAPSDGIFKVG